MIRRIISYDDTHGSQGSRSQGARKVVSSLRVVFEAFMVALAWLSALVLCWAAAVGLVGILGNWCCGWVPW